LLCRSDSLQTVHRQEATDTHTRLSEACSLEYWREKERGVGRGQ
jgi:hypothetical protein